MGLTERSFLERMEEMGFTARKSNYDRIISKSPEELAEWIDHIQADAYERGLMETPVVDYPNIYSGWLDWLKQEANNGNLH